MPTVPEETKEQLDMDEFINWENAAPAIGMTGFTLEEPLPQGPGTLDRDPNLELALENAFADDLSFWAMEHFVSSNANATADETTNPVALGDAFAIAGDNPVDMVLPSPSNHQEHFYVRPAVPCFECALRGYGCKKIREGDCTDCCTSCVALRKTCSFAIGPNHQHAYQHEKSASDDLASTRPGINHSSSAPELVQIATVADGRAVSDSSNNGSNNNLADALAAGAVGPGKTGARLSRESLRVLKSWFSTHSRHPYPTDEEKESLQRLTGLSRTQITNWLANYRRRNNKKSQQTRSTSPHVRNLSMANPIDIPQRRATPSPLERRQHGDMEFESMNPLQRWANSPPEHEPASVSDIARAVSASSRVSSGVSSSGLDSPFRVSYTDDGSGRSLGHGSSVSSLGTSHSSGGSFASAYSHASRNSFSSSIGSLGRGRRRRRRRAAPRGLAADGPVGLSTLQQPLKTFQCTFCTDTFRTKHDWQRHEKSLHLSLERWLCAPGGARAPNPNCGGELQCVFCGEANPDEAHLETHNYAACQERGEDERTFYRKDHLRQHLKLVHSAKFVDWSMSSWGISAPEIRSRCGFCGIVMDTWSFRVDHLADHFKTGNTMADWKGDWGFEQPVLELVQNSIPPYLIHDERNSPLPFTATYPSPSTPIHGYDLIKSELWWYATRFRDDTGREPTDSELQEDACRIVFGAEVVSGKPISSNASWLRDLVMSSREVTERAKLGPIRGPADSRMNVLKINGKDNMFEDCPLERQLQEYVTARLMLGLTAMDSELQARACNILAGVEESSSNPSELVANFLLRLINGSTGWLEAFRRRAHLPRSQDIADERQRPADRTKIDSTIHNYSRLEAELGEYVRSRRQEGIEPDDSDLQRQARIIIYEYDDAWNQTAADNQEWLEAFRSRLASRCPQMTALTFESLKQRRKPKHYEQQQQQQEEELEQQLEQMFALQPAAGSSLSPTATFSSVTPAMMTSTPSSTLGASNPDATQQQQQQFGPPGIVGGADCGPSAGYPGIVGGANCGPSPGGAMTSSLVYGRLPPCPPVRPVARRVKPSPFFLHDMNCYRRLEMELGRYVMAAMSPNNPDRHVPTDAELHHQARWIIYNDDDPWNQTPADNAEWLQRFKRDYGIIPADDPSRLPGLPQGDAWAVQQGGTGFAPPYLYPRGGAGHLARLEGEGPDDVVQVPLRLDSAPFEADQRTANKYLQSYTTRYAPPATVFCSRELESGLAAFVFAHGDGDFPSDDALRARAREILKTDVTAADDQGLLDKFKSFIRGGGAQLAAPLAASGFGAEGEKMDLGHIPDSQLDEMLLDMELEALGGNGGGVSLTGSPSLLL